MELKQAIIHELVKEVTKAGEPDLGTHINTGDILNIADEPVLNLIDDISAIYGKKGNSSSQGIFDAGSGNTFATAFSAFLNNTVDFELFSQQTMAYLKLTASGQRFATGGYLVFGHYSTEAGNEMILIAMVKKQKGFTLENLVPKTVQTVGMSKIHQAVHINVNRYKQWQDNTTDESQEVNDINAYLSFISPKANADASGYFINAIGCSNAVPDKQATASVLQAVSGFFAQHEDLKLLAKEAKNHIATNLYDESKSDNPECQLSTVAGWVRGLLPENLQNEYGDAFEEYANNDPYNVPSIFKPNSTEAKKGMKLKISSGSQWSLNMDIEALGSTNNQVIQYNETEQSLTINSLPSHVISKIKAALAG